MRKYILLIMMIATSAVLIAATNPKPFVVPEVKMWKGSEGAFKCNSGTRIVLTSSNPQLRQVADNLSDDWNNMFGQRLSVEYGRIRTGDIVLSMTKHTAPEAYSMISSDIVVIDARSPKGVYWGTRTLLQIAEQTVDHLIPCGAIYDEPDYEMRGMMIDCGRKFIPMDYLRNLVKVMSYYKMNTLQVHLNDNGFKQYFQNDWDKTYSAFRLESTTFPGLAAGDGFYTKAEFHDFIKEAARLGVEIIPEIDAPAHTLAFYHYNHALGSKEYGADHMDLKSQETYNFLDALWREYLWGQDPVFCCPRVHIGTDEYSNRDPETVELFRTFTDYYIKYVEKFGKQACLWGALSHANGKTGVKSKNVIMNIWYNGYADPHDMQKLGYNLLSIPDGSTYIVPAAGYYYDYLNCKELYANWTPAHIGDQTFPERASYLRGGMFAVWNDHCGNGISVSDIHHRVFPAIQTLSAKTWSATYLTLPYEEFAAKSRMLSEAPFVNELGRYLKEPGIVEERNVVGANQTFNYDFIGYNYRVSFSIDGYAEKPGTVLFSSSRSTFYLSDPANGHFGFSRDGYLITFKQKLLMGNHKYAVEGDNKSTRLYVDDRLVEELSTYPVWYSADGKAMMNNVRTLVFPLRQAGTFNSKVYDLKVEQL